MFAVTSERKGMGQTGGGEGKKNEMVCREEVASGKKGKEKCVERNDSRPRFRLREC